MKRIYIIIAIVSGLTSAFITSYYLQSSKEKESEFNPVNVTNWNAALKTESEKVPYFNQDTTIFLTETQLAQAKITLDETCDHYNLNNRSQSGAYCMYQSGSGDRCAVGRMLTDNGLNKVVDENKNVWCDVVDLLASTDTSIFQPRFRSLTYGGGIYFLMQIQRLHDNESNWDKNGLSAVGKQYAQNIRHTFLLK